MRWAAEPHQEIFMARPIEHEESGGDAVASDRELVKRCVSGDKEAWESFLHDQGGRIRHAIRQIMTHHGVHTLDEEVEDLHAEVLASLVADDYRRLRTYEGRNGCRLTTWVALVTARFVHSRLAGLRRWEVGRHGHVDPTILLSERLDDGPDAEAILVHQQAVERMERALLRLSSADQLFVKLCFYQEWPGAEIARFLGVSQATVYSRKHRILQRLRALLAGPDSDPSESNPSNDLHGTGERP
jgi:RNA polymerase sigma factor (sigma-70 family)